jgi:acetyl esterase
MSVDYRLAPEQKYPAAVEDAYAAVCWAAEHGRELGGDPSRLAVLGDSAGGNLSAVVALMARERGGPKIALQVLVYPVTNHSYDTDSYRRLEAGYFLTKGKMAWYWGHYLPNEAAGREPYASPLRAESLEGLPPALVITAEYDPLRDEGEAFARRLREAGVPVTYTCYSGALHGFFNRPDFDLCWEAVDETANALKAAFGLPSSGT